MFDRFSDYNGHTQPIVRDHGGDGKSIFQMQQDDARAYLEVSKSVLPDTELFTKENKQSHDWKYWYKLYASGRWNNFPQVTYGAMPKLKDGETVDMVAWNDIIRKVTAQMERDDQKWEQFVDDRAAEVDNGNVSDDIQYVTIDSSIRETPNSTTVLKEALTAHSRPPRQILWFLTMAAIAIGSLIYSSTEVTTMADTAQHNQDITIQQLNQIDHKLLIQGKAIRLLNSSITLLEQDVAELDTRLTVDELISECNIALELYYDEVTRVIRGLSSLSRNELSVDLIDMGALNRNLKSLRDRIENQGYVLSLEKIEHIFQAPVSYVLYGNGSLWAFAHLSCYRKAAMYQLWQFNRVPFLSPSSEGDVALSLRPEAEMIAISEDDARHLLFDRNDLDKCNFVGKLRVCDEANVINTKTKQSCLSALFLNDIEAVKNHCRWHSSNRAEFIQQINSNQFICYFTTPQTNFKISCSDGKDTVEKRMSVDGAVRLTLQGGCRAYTDHHILEGRLEWSIETSTYQVNPINTTELLSTPYFTITPDKWNTWDKIRVQIGSPEGLKFKDIGPLYWKYKTEQYWGIGIVTVLSIFVPLLILFLVYYFRKRIFAWCQSKAKDRGYHFEGGYLPRKRGPNDPPRRVPPPPPGSTPMLSDTPAAQGADDIVGIATPRTAQRVLNRMNWSEEQKQQSLANAELIKLASQAGSESEKLLVDTGAVSPPGCPKCLNNVKRCRCTKSEI